MEVKSKIIDIEKLATTPQPRRKYETFYIDVMYKNEITDAILKDNNWYSAKREICVNLILNQERKTGYYPAPVLRNRQMRELADKLKEDYYRDDIPEHEFDEFMATCGVVSYVYECGSEQLKVRCQK